MQEKIYTSNGNIMYLYNVMKKYTDINHPLKVTEIVELIKKEYDEDVSSRTIRRDFKVLETKFNIVVDKIDDGYYIDYDENDFDTSEIRCLVDMVNYSKFIDDDLAKNFTYKLINQLNENDKKEFDGYEKYMSGTKTKNKEVFFNIQILAEAILNKKRIRFKYYKYNLKKEQEFRKPFDITPLTITCDIGQYYLVAVNDEKKLLYFRIDRIKKLELTDGKIVKISKKQVNDFITSTVGMFGGEKEKVQAIVTNKAIDEVIEVFGIDTKIEKYDENNFIMETEVNLEGFKHWGLRHLEDAKIIYPEELKNEILKILENSMKSYKEK